MEKIDSKLKSTPLTTERFHIRLKPHQEVKSYKSQGSLISSIQQETSESVIVAVVIAEETSNGQVDSHLVPSIQVEGHN